MPGSRGLVSKEFMSGFGDNINKARNYGCRGDTGSNYIHPLNVSFNKTTPVHLFDVLRPRTSKADGRRTTLFYHGFLYEALPSRRNNVLRSYSPNNSGT